MKSLIFSFLAVLVLAGCSNYGDKVSKDYLEVYYKDGITKDEAQKTANFLFELDKSNNSKTTKSFQLTGKGDTVLCKMVVNKEKLDNMPPDESFIMISNLLSDSVFNGRPVNFDLTDNKFVSTRTVYYKKTNYGNTANSYGEKITSGNVEVYVTGGASMSDGKVLAQLLEKEFNPSNIISFQLTKSDGLNAVRMVFAKEKLADLTDEEITNLAAKISDGVFDSSPLVFEFTDTQFNTLKTFTYDPE